MVRPHQPRNLPNPTVRRPLAHRVSKIFSLLVRVVTPRRFLNNDNHRRDFLHRRRLPVCVRPAKLVVFVGSLHKPRPPACQGHMLGHGSKRYPLLARDLRLIHPRRILRRAFQHPPLSARGFVPEAQQPHQRKGVRRHRRHIISGAKRHSGVCRPRSEKLPWRKTSCPGVVARGKPLRRLYLLLFTKPGKHRRDKQ